MTLETLPSRAAAAGRAPTIKRRRWWLAAILSLMVPGLGQLYAICPKRAAWMLAVVTAIHVSLGLILGYVPPVRLETIVAVAILALLIIVIRLYSAVDAAVIVWYGGAPALRSYNRFWVYCAILVGWTAASHFGLAGAQANGLLWQPYVIVGESMAPTLHGGECALGAAGYYRSHVPVAGEVVVVALDDGRRALSRIVAGPGARVAVSGGELAIDGRPVPRQPVAGARGTYRETLPGGASYEIHSAESSAALLPVEVPAGHYLVVGDNRDNATPRLGPRAALDDRMSILIFSRDRARFGSRLGPPA
jgi:signal peptidase I